MSLAPRVGSGMLQGLVSQSQRAHLRTEGPRCICATVDGLPMYAPHSEIQLGFCAELAVPEINAGRQLAAALARTDAVQVFACALYM